jgi:hypothetical protein
MCGSGYLDYRCGRSQLLVRCQIRLVMCRVGRVEGASATTGASHVAPVTLSTRCSSSVLGFACGTDRPSVAPISSVWAAVLVHVGQVRRDRGLVGGFQGVQCPPDRKLAVRAVGNTVQIVHCSPLALRASATSVSGPN